MPQVSTGFETFSQCLGCKRLTYVVVHASKYDLTHTKLPRFEKCAVAVRAREPVDCAVSHLMAFQRGTR